MSNPLKKIVIIGPESTGKSTLAQGLAAEFGEPWVPEFAREYLQELNKPYEYEDLLEIAKGQLAIEHKMALWAERFLFCDTDLQVIAVWSQHKFGKVHPWILQNIQERKYDFYLLTNIDIPWQADPQREHPDPEMRQYFFNIYHQRLIKSGLPFKIISGNQTERLDHSKEEIEKWIEVQN